MCSENQVGVGIGGGDCDLVGHLVPSEGYRVIFFLPSGDRLILWAINYKYELSVSLNYAHQKRLHSAVSILSHLPHQMSVTAC